MMSAETYVTGGIPSEQMQEVGARVAWRAAQYRGPGHVEAEVQKRDGCFRVLHGEAFPTTGSSENVAADLEAALNEPGWARAGR